MKELNIILNISFLKLFDRFMNFVISPSVLNSTERQEKEIKNFFFRL